MDIMPTYAWSLYGIIQEISQRCGLPYDRILVGHLPAHVKGFSTTVSHSASQAIDTLSDQFLFDASNYGGIVHFIPRGGSPVLTLDPNNFVEEDKSAKRATRKDSISIPRVANLLYFDIDGGLTPDKQTSDRGASLERNKAEGTTESTIIMSADEAAASVVISHKISIEEQRGEVKFSLPDSYIGLVCGDVVTLDEQRLRIVEIEVDNGVQHYTAKHDRLSAYQTTIKGVPVDPPSPPPDLVVSDTILEIIDCPIISSFDDSLGYYVMTASKTFDWTGAVIEISKDGGETWIDSDNTSANGILGKVATPIRAHSAHYPDRGNTLTVTLARTDMELETATMGEMMNRSNLAIIGDELINFSDAEQVADDTWELRGLLRGRRGTAPVAHVVGERFVLMVPGMVSFVDAELFELGRALTFRATSFGVEPGTETTTIIFQGRSQQERQPAYLKARRVGSDLQVSWQGVGKIGGGVDVGMGAYFTEYRVRLGATVVNTRETSATIPYQTGVLTVQQVNQITGVGPAISQVIA